MILSYLEKMCIKKMFDMLEKKTENSVDIYVSRGNNFYTVM